MLNPKGKFLISAGVVLGIIAFAWWVTDLASDSALIQDVITKYGYRGIFVAAVISGFNLIVPIPAVSFLPALLEAGLNYWLSVLILALGMTVADGIAYILGRAGRGVFLESSKNKLVTRLERLKDSHPRLALLLVFIFASLAPLPNEVLVIPLGFLRFKMYYVMLIVFLGNIIFNALYSRGFIELFKII